MIYEVHDFPGRDYMPCAISILRFTAVEKSWFNQLVSLHQQTENKNII
jgi:hypothetical protein